ncbi:MAG: lytic transglycosylase domain-containing protein [Christensenellaceae bacterium]|jgi:soluble lytic murein transglycosylase|nr:lytic transglycosylase domain-containing protein [Christensenellaceae bacterium]
MKKAIVVLLSILLLCGGIFAAHALNIRMEKRKYKLEYKEQILRYAEEFTVDPYLVAAMIHCESGNAAQATSPRGAMGLMQIMPDTGAWIAEKLGVTPFETDMLYDPDVNIRFGCWYLNYLLNKFEGVRRHAVIAYNAGPGNLAKWLGDDALAVDGKLVSIPFAETETYIDRVENAYAKYKKLYAEELG